MEIKVHNNNIIIQYDIVKEVLYKMSLRIVLDKCKLLFYLEEMFAR